MDLDRELPPQIDWEDVPRWYGLSYRPATKIVPPAIIFDIRKESAAPLKQVLEHKGFMAGYAHHGLLFFESDITRGFGFEGAMACEGEFEGYVRLVMTLDPRKGAPFHALNYIILLDALDMSYIDVRAGGDPKRTQLMELRAGYSVRDGGFHSAPMGGKTAPALRRWMEKIYPKHQRLRNVEAAMIEVYSFLSDFVRERKISKRSLSHSISAHVGKKGSFSLMTLGNACDVSTDEWWSVEDGCGHHLVDHNLDSPLQQISLLAGFAALHGMAAKALDPR